MLYEKEIIHYTRECANTYGGKNVAVYGTGNIARCILSHCDGLSIAGVLDRIKICGQLEGYQVISWEEAVRLKVEAVIVAAPIRYFREIYLRISDICGRENIQIFGYDGCDLEKRFGGDRVRFQDLSYYDRSYDELKKLAEQYGAVSFDLFDTLIMRKVSEPSDVFDLVTVRAEGEGMKAGQFKQQRIMAEVAGGGNIYDIYERLQQIMGITSREKERLLEIELECEKSTIIPRKRMVELFHYVVGQGKMVTIISDMYLTKQQLADMLDGLGIKGYLDILVSCDYGAGKGNGLFRIYKERVSSDSYLHIGDNRAADGDAAEAEKIDSYLIRSAAEMLDLSYFRRVRGDIKSINDRLLIGQIMAEVFNDPFSLNHMYGRIEFSEAAQWARVFIAPLVWVYVTELAERVSGECCYDKVLFSARDGYLLQKLFRKVRDKWEIENGPEDVYLLTSRLCAIRAGMGTTQILDYLRQIYGEEEWEKILGKLINDKEAADLPDDQLLVISAQAKRRYNLYIDKLNLKKGNKYLLCDLISQGTVQYMLTRFVPYDIKGFFLAYLKNNKFKNISVEAVYEPHPSRLEASELIQLCNLLETVLTAPVPSIRDFNEEGEPVYEEERRSDMELSFLENAQRGISETFDAFLDGGLVRGEKINPHLVLRLLGEVTEMIYRGECKVLGGIILRDDLNGKEYRIMKAERGF